MIERDKKKVSVGVSGFALLCFGIVYSTVTAGFPGCASVHHAGTKHIDG